MIRRVVYDAFGRRREGEQRRPAPRAAFLSVPPIWTASPRSFVPGFMSLDGRSPGFLPNSALGPTAWQEQQSVLRVTGYQGNHALSGGYDGETPSIVYANDLGDCRFGNKELLVLYRVMNDSNLNGGPMFFMGIRGVGAYSAVTKGWGPDSITTYYLNRCLSLGYSATQRYDGQLPYFKVGLSGVWTKGSTATNDYGGSTPGFYINTIYDSFYYPWIFGQWYWLRSRIEWPYLRVKVWSGAATEPENWVKEIDLSKSLYPGIYILGDFYDRKGAGLCGVTHSGWGSNSDPYNSYTYTDIGFWGESVLNFHAASIKSWQVIN